MGIRKQFRIGLLLPSTMIKVFTVVIQYEVISMNRWNLHVLFLVYAFASSDLYYDHKDDLMNFGFIFLMTTCWHDNKLIHDLMRALPITGSK